MHYTQPEVIAYRSNELAELAGPVETQYIANPSVEGNPCREFEVCFDYNESWCDGKLKVYRIGAEFDDYYEINNGRICVPLTRSQGYPESFIETFYIECDGEKSNELEVRIPSCEPT